jgi:hypothetical protein
MLERIEDAAVTGSAQLSPTYIANLRREIADGTLESDDHALDRTNRLVLLAAELYQNTPPGEGRTGPPLCGGAS